MDKEMMESVIKTLKSDLVQVTGVNEEEVAALVSQAKGENRTLTEFAEVTGISKPTLSRIMNGKIARPLTLETIVTIIGNSEQNTLKTMYRLAAANGYMSKAEQSALRSRNKLRETRNGFYASLKSYMMTIITAELFQRGIGMNESVFESQSGTIPTSFDKSIRYDYCFNVESEDEEYTWYFFDFPQSMDDFKDSNIKPDYLARNIIRELSLLLLTDAWYPEGYSKCKFSFCFTDRETFEELSKLLINGHLNAEMSTILVGGEDEPSVIEEKIFRAKTNHQCLFNLPKKISIIPGDDNLEEDNEDPNFLLVEEDQL